MKKWFFLCWVLFIAVLFSIDGQAKKTYYVVANGKEYIMPKSAYDLLKNDRKGTAAEYVFRWYRIPVPKSRKYVLRSIDNGVPDSSTKDSEPHTVSLSLKDKSLKMLTGDVRKPEFYQNTIGITWMSMNKKIVKPVAGGSLKAKKSGDTTVFTIAGGKLYKCTVSVTSKSEDNRINSALRKMIKKGMKKRDKVRAVHNWMISHINYDYNSYLRGKVPKSAHTSEGALLKKSAVCDGYASAFSKFMDKLKIPNQIVYGYATGNGRRESHAWNRVKLKGKWKYIDVTYDDPIVNGSNKNKTPYYDFFLKPRKKMNRTHTIVRFNL